MIQIIKLPAAGEVKKCAVLKGMEVRMSWKESGGTSGSRSTRPGEELNGAISSFNFESVQNCIEERRKKAGREKAKAPCPCAIHPVDVVTTKIICTEKKQLHKTANEVLTIVTK